MSVVISKKIGNDTVKKIYGQAAFAVSTNLSYQLDNYIVIKGADGDGGLNQLLLDGGGVTGFLGTVLNGIAHADVRGSGVLTKLATQINALNTVGTSLGASTHPSLYRLKDIAPILEGFDHGAVVNVVGLSNELAGIDKLRTGPYNGSSPSQELYNEATDSDTLLIGASGASGKNVNYSSRTDYLRGSSGNDVLIAGTGSITGSGSAQYNVLEGMDGDDILLGRGKDDKLQGGNGKDLAILSLGQDIVEGGADDDILLVADDLNSIDIDISKKETGYTAITIGSDKTKVKEVEFFVGNASVTTFRGNNEGSVFISGTGGGKFYLTSGDQGIGNSAASDEFYIDASVPAQFSSWDSAKKISYLETNKVYVGNFGPEDKIFIKKNGTFVLFNGNTVTTAVAGDVVPPEKNADIAVFAYAMTGDSSYGTSYPTSAFEVRGQSYIDRPWGALLYTDGDYRDVSFGKDTETGMGAIQFTARTTTAFERGASTNWSGDTGYELNPLSENDEQLTVIISGFQNGYGGINFANDTFSNGRVPGRSHTGTNWEDLTNVEVPVEGDTVDGNPDGHITPGGPTVNADDPAYYSGMGIGGEYFDWDGFLSGPKELSGSPDADYLQGGWAADTIIAGDGDDYIVGGPGDDLLDGGDGNDEIYGGEGKDTLLGGSGDDLLYGGDGNDTLNGGDGDDELYGETGNNIIDGGDGADVAHFGGSTSDFRTYRKLDGTVVVEELDNPGSFQTITNVETLSFYDGAVDVGDLPMGTTGNDVLTGSVGADLLDGGAGDDTLEGGDGDDVYAIDSAGDVVTENLFEGTDTIRSSVATYILGDNVENLVFSGSGAFVGTGNDLDNAITGGLGNDTLTGGIGYDRFAGIAGADTIDGGDDWDTVVLAGKPEDYSYSVDGLGVVTITDGANSVQLTDVEYVEFAGGSSFEISALVTRFVTGTAGNDAMLTGNSNENKIRGLAGDDNLSGGDGDDLLDGGDGQDTAYFAGNSDDYAIYQSPYGGLVVEDLSGSDGTDWLTNMESLHFDGDNVTIAVSAIAPLGTSDNDTIAGSTRADRLYGLAGNDSLTGGGNGDILDGGAGDDTLDGGSANDTLFGGAGNDTVIFGTGNDVAQDDAGDDTYVYEAGDGGDRVRDDGGTDAIVLGSAITPGDVTFSVDDDDIILTFAGGGSLTIQNGLIEGNEIEEIRFDDSTVWNPIVRLQTPTSGNDTLIGTISADTLSGSAGNDSIEGRQGNDTISGDTGDDVLSGGAGDDTYLFALGDGVDVVQDDSTNSNYGSGGNDTLIFGAGIAPIDIQVSMANGSDLVLTIAGTADQVTLKNSVLRVSENIETIQFADTTVWTHADLMSRALVSTSGDNSLYGSFAADTISAGAGNDYINAREGNDILTGGTGNDSITGGAGNDTYYFNLGDGQDYIHDFTNDVATSLDAIVFGAGILPADIVVTQADNGRDLVLSIAGTSDKITINDAAFVTGYRIEEVRFADSTVWTHNDLMANAYSARSTGDTYWGTTAADTISGGGGNDLIIASGGNDTLAGGTGNDTLYGDAGTDTVLLMGLRPTYSMLTSGGFLKVTDNAPTVDGNDGTDDLRGVEKLRFSDNEEIGIVSPIILDLDGRGVTTVSAYVGRARYDMDGDGIADLTSWIGRGEGMLFLDRDGNGTLSNAGEFSFANDVEGAASDLVGLRAFDSNGDGSLSSSDSRFADFRIWRDRNGNGSVQDGEIVTLGEVGVAALNLNGEAVSGNTAIGDVAVLNTGSYTRTDGREMQFIDAALTYFSGASQTSGSSSVGQQVGPFSRGQLHAFDRDELRGGRHRPLLADGQYERDPIAHWSQFGDQRMWSGPSVMALDDLGHFSSPQASAASPASGVDRQLAMMVQEMSVFGARSAGEGLGALQRENTRPLDFFA